MVPMLTDKKNNKKKTLMVFQRHNKCQSKQHKKREETNIWGNIIICPLQMCSDFPCGLVNVNRISRGIITFPQAAEKTQACGYFCTLGLSQSRDTEDPTGERVAHILICSQTLANQTENSDSNKARSSWLSSAGGISHGGKIMNACWY